MNDPAHGMKELLRPRVPTRMIRPQPLAFAIGRCSLHRKDRGGDVQERLSVAVEFRNGIGRIAPVGDLDMFTVPDLEDHLRNVEAEELDAIVLDVRDVTFADSTALHAFVDAKERGGANGHTFLIVGVGSRLRRLFELTQIEFLLADHEAAPLLERFTSARGHASNGDGSGSGG